ncbi:hypothetical protein CAPTEDRAFT_218796 [Capitella teleta]|uniref:UBZ1-type domain-containing protein n=1 Tax=Capitella teleta TaxID=283909 RepID=R7TWC4_CAPTE|nr:hypothetical protein CAPTEDRAFT_218796 [Capitella teleta]|eukprot:ELT98218.1 hypothetical protein CAPTEDRAFT_218796 [Capitella teleta]
MCQERPNMVQASDRKMSRSSGRRGAKSAPVYTTENIDLDPASQHALDFAYNDLKKRYNELSKKNVELLKRVKRESSSLDESVISSFHGNDCTPLTTPPVFSDLQKQLENQQRKNIDLEKHNEDIMKENILLKKRLGSIESESAQVKAQNELMKEQLNEAQKNDSLLTNGEESELIAGLQQLLQVVAQQRAEMSALRKLAEHQKSAIQQLLLSPSNRDSPMLSIPLQCTDMEMDIASMSTMLNDPSLVPPIAPATTRPKSSPISPPSTRPKSAQILSARPKSVQISPQRPSLSRSSHTAPLPFSQRDMTLPCNNSRSRVAVENSEPRPINFDRNFNQTEGARSNHSANPNLLPPSPPAFSALTMCADQKPVPTKNIFDWTPRDRTDNVERPEGPPQICPVCSTSFTPSMSVQAFQDHVNECLPLEEISSDSNRVCPMCNEQFSDSVTDRDFHEHVDRHFDTDFSIVGGSDV